jgi:tRNA A-37 threonylcarbamoyl transferase component Bud32
MARHELTVTREMRELGVNAPAPLAAFDHEGNGVLVFEYLPSFQTLDELDPEHVEAIVPQLFDALARVHGAGLAHGDIRSENVLVVDGDLYFIDATSVREDAADETRAYDLACALAALEPLIGAGVPVTTATDSHGQEAVLAADRFLDFVNIRPDHHFDATAVRGEISKAVG